MVTVIDLEDDGLTLREVIQSIKQPAGVFLRRKGTVIARLEPVDELDLDDEIWAHAPKQIARGRAARRRFDQGLGIPLEEVRRRLGLTKSPKPRARQKPRTRSKR